MKGKSPVFDRERLRAVREEQGFPAIDVTRMAKVTARHICSLAGMLVLCLSFASRSFVCTVVLMNGPSWPKTGGLMPGAS